MHVTGRSEIIELKNPKKEKGQFLIAIQLDILKGLLKVMSNCN